MRRLTPTLILLLSGAATAGPSDVGIYAGYGLGEVKTIDTIRFEFPVDEAILKAMNVRKMYVYADKEALAAPSTVTQCDLTKLGGPAFPSTLVRLKFSKQEATRIESMLNTWRASGSTNRTLSFTRNGRLVHGHDPALATVSESMLHLHVGPLEEAQSVLKAVCGDA